MQPTLPCLGHVLLTLDQHPHLRPHLIQPTEHLFISIHKPQDLIPDSGLFAELLDMHLQLAQVMPWHPREKMMHGLELKPAVDEVQPFGAVDVHGRAELALGEGFCVAEVGGGGCPMREGDLRVEGHGDDVGYEHESHSERPGGDTAPEETVPENVPVAEHEYDLGGACPGRRPEVHATAIQQMQPGQQVEVEAGDAHDGVVGVFLVGDEEVGGGVPGEDEAIVVGGDDGAEEFGRGGEEWDVLDVGVMFLLRNCQFSGFACWVREALELTGWLVTR